MNHKHLHYVALLSIILTFYVVILTYLSFKPANQQVSAFEAPTDLPGSDLGGLISIDPITKSIVFNSDIEVEGDLEFTGRAEYMGPFNAGGFCNKVATCGKKGDLFINYNDPCEAINDGALIQYPLGITCVERGLPVTGRVVVDNVTTKLVQELPTVSFSHVISGSNRLLLVAASFNPHDSPIIQSVTYNSQALTRLGYSNQGNDIRVEIWKLVNPPVGNYNVVVNWSNGKGRAAVIGAISFNNVNQTTPTGLISYSDNISTTPLVDVASSANDLVFAVVGCRTRCDSITTSINQTTHWNLVAVPNHDYETRGHGTSKTAAAGNVTTISWTFADQNYWAAAGVAIKP